MFGEKISAERYEQTDEDLRATLFAKMPGQKGLASSDADCDANPDGDTGESKPKEGKEGLG